MMWRKAAHMFSENDPITEASCVGASCDKIIWASCDMSEIALVTFPNDVTTCPHCNNVPL